MTLWKLQSVRKMWRGALIDSQEGDRRPCRSLHEVSVSTFCMAQQHTHTRARMPHMSISEDDRLYRHSSQEAPSFEGQ